MQERVYERLLPRTVDEIHSGRGVTWGPITLDAQGMTLRFGGSYGWDGIRGLGVSRLGGCLTIYTGTSSRNTGIHVDAVPNYLLVFRIAEVLGRA